MSEIEQGKIHDAAMIAHEANRAYCLTIGDSSQPDWRSAPNWQRDSAIVGAEAIAKDPSTSPEQSHEGWSAQKVADGWVYGPVKDAEAKTHPCLVPYDELPDDQKRKDALFGGVVRAVLGLPQREPLRVLPLDSVTRDQHNAVVEAMEETINELDAQLAKLRGEAVTSQPTAEPTASEGAES